MANKSIVKNSIYSVIYKLMNALFPLITVGYASHTILAKGMGTVASAQNIVQYFVLLAALGIPNYGIREIAKVNNSQLEMNRVFSELFALNGISTVISALMYVILICIHPFFSCDYLLYLIVGISVLLNFANVDWFYQGIEEYGYIAKRSIIVKVVCFLLVIFFVNEPDDYYIYALISVFGVAGNYFFNLFNLNRHGIKVSFHSLNIRRHLRPVFILLGTTLSIELYTLLDTTMITAFCESENVAYYSNSMKIVKMLIIVITAICTVLLPRLSKYVEEGKEDECNFIVNKVVEILLFLFLPCGIGIIGTADCIVPIMFGDSFEPAIFTLRISALLIYALGFSNLFGTQILLSFGDEGKLLLCTVCGAISNIVLNLVLIPNYQQNGAAIASVISESIVTIVAFGFSRKHIRYRLNIRMVVATVFSSVGLALYLVAISQLHFSSLIKMVIDVIGGVIVYGALSILLRNPTIKDIKIFFDRRKKDEVKI